MNGTYYIAYSGTVIAGGVGVVGGLFYVPKEHQRIQDSKPNLVVRYQVSAICPPPGYLYIYDADNNPGMVMQTGDPPQIIESQIDLKFACQTTNVSLYVLAFYALPENR